MLLRHLVLGLVPVLLLLVSHFASADAMVMLYPPEGQTSIYLGGTAGYQSGRVFFLTWVRAEHPEGNGNDYEVTAHFKKGTYEETASMDHKGGGIYKNGRRYITTKRSFWDLWVTGTGASPSGHATVHLKKNGQRGTCAPDWEGIPYH